VPGLATWTNAKLLAQTQLVASESSTGMAFMVLGVPSAFLYLPDHHHAVPTTTSTTARRKALASHVLKRITI